MDFEKKNALIWTKFDDKFKSWDKKEYEEAPKYIYHYTRLEVLESLFLTKELHMTEYNQLNDPLEFNYGLNVIFKTLEKKIEKKTASLNALKEKISDFTEENAKCYIFSFCDKGDYLPAWRYYGANGLGCSIAFDKNAFKPNFSTLSKNEEDKENIERMMFQKVIYGEADSNIKYFCSQLADLFKTIKTVEECKEYCITVHCHVFPQISRIKQVHFNDEIERRLIFNRIGEKISKSNERIGQRCCPLSLSDKHKNLIKSPFECKYYYKHEFDINAIREIIVGPSLDFEKTQSYLNDFFNDLLSRNVINQKVEIRKSDLNYRGN